MSVCEQDLFYRVDIELQVPNVSVYSLDMVIFTVIWNSTFVILAIKQTEEIDMFSKFWGIFAKMSTMTRQKYRKVWLYANE